MSPAEIGALCIVVVLILMALEVPIAVAMAMVGFVGFAFVVSLDGAYNVIAKDLFNTFNSYTMSMLVMFVMMGYFAFHAGIGSQLYQFANKTLGYIPGGVAMANEVACALFGAVCGSSTATAATMGSIALPEMRKIGYSDSLATASVAAGGTLAILIPPSVIFVLYGIATEQSIGSLFMAGIFPGIMLTLLFMVAIYITVRRKPHLAPRQEGRPQIKEIVQSLRGGLIETLLIFGLSLGGLFAGWFTPTEAGAVGAAGVFTIGVVERRLGYKEIRRALADTTRTSAMILMLIAGATIFGRLIAVSRIPFELAETLGAMTVPAWTIMLLILLIHLILGMFIDAMAMILLTIPIFYPLAVGQLGYDPIWFGVIIVFVAAMGVITPPVGINVYVVEGVANGVRTPTIFKGVWPFLAAIVVASLLLMIFPQIATWLPYALD